MAARFKVVFRARIKPAQDFAILAQVCFDLLHVIRCERVLELQEGSLHDGELLLERRDLCFLLSQEDLVIITPLEKEKKTIKL